MTDGVKKVRVSIDGIEVSVPDGTPIIEAAARAGINIPRFCYHKLLKPYAGCRMCLVEITKGSENDPRPFPKPQPSCATPVQNGMVVITNSPEIKRIREGITEFTLTNHPLDCPICDKGGECDLQDVAYLYGRDESRFIEDKIFNRNRNLSSLIILDTNRCILCKRCVRWTEEIADDDRLVYIDRGAHTTVSTFNNQPFVSRFAGMTIDLCPVGALTSNVFRFKARAWEVSQIHSSCVECPLGCSFTAQYRDDRIMRFVSKENPEINAEFFCDRGRFAHDWIDHPDRIVQPVARKDGKFVKIGWEDAVGIFAEAFRRNVQNHGPRSIAACIEPHENIESLWTFRRLFRDVLGAVRIEHAPAPLGLDPDDMPGLFARLASLDQVLTGKNTILWGSDPLDEIPVLGLRLKLAWEEGEIDGVSVSPVSTYLGSKGFPEYVIPPHRGRIVLAEIVKNLAAKIGKIPDEINPAIEQAKSLTRNIRPEVKKIAMSIYDRIIKPDALLVIGTPVLRARKADIAALFLIAQLREIFTGSYLPILPMFPESDSLAAILFGLRTQLKEGPGGPMLVGFTGESATGWPDEIANGKIKAIFASGDSLVETIGTDGLRKFESLDFLAVTADFMNPLASRADLVIPKLAPWENSGTYIALDGGIRRISPVVNNPAGVWSMNKFFAEVARNLGENIAESPEDIAREISKAYPAFNPLTKGEKQKLDRPSKAAFRLGDSGIAFKPLDPPETGTFRAVLTETIFRHDSRGNHSPHVSGMPEEFCIGVSKQDAEKLNLRAGALVRVVSERGGIDTRIKILDLPKGYILVPAGYIDYPINNLGVLSNPDERLWVLEF
ncbi:MAG TPA: 2Fe-2S iron-sulfur cluster binding domain-containing protein [Firmicutes bacterium]|nr:2Fe-2S iron-sulfur cluster binding domain-containing protein [Bacillota bacterium]